MRRMECSRIAERGTVVIFAMMVSLLLFAFSAALLGLNLYSSRSINAAVDGDVAFYIAEAAANKAIHELNDSDAGTTGVLGTAQSNLNWVADKPALGTYYVTVSGTDPKVVTAHAFYKGIERVLQVTLKPKSQTIVVPFLAAVESTSTAAVSNLGQECRYFTYAGHDKTTGMRVSYPQDINGVPPATGDMKGVDFKNIGSDPLTSTDKYGTFGLILKGWYGAMPDNNIGPTMVFGDVKIQGTWSHMTWMGAQQGYFYHGDPVTGRCTSAYDPSVEAGHQNITFTDLPPKSVDDAIADLRAATGITDPPRTYAQGEAELAAASSLLAKAVGTWANGIDQPYNASTNPNGNMNGVTVTMRKSADGTTKTVPWTTVVDADGDFFANNSNTGSGYDEIYLPTGNYYLRSLSLAESRSLHFGGGSKVYVWGTDTSWAAPYGIRLYDNARMFIQFDGNGDLAVARQLYVTDSYNKFIRAGGTYMGNLTSGGDLNVTVGGGYDSNESSDASEINPILCARTANGIGGNLTVNLVSTNLADDNKIEFGADKLVKVNADHLGKVGAQGTTLIAKERFDIYVRQDFIYGATSGSNIFEGANGRNSYLMVKGNATLGPNINSSTWAYLKASDRTVSTRRNPRERMIFVKGLDGSGNLKGGRPVDLNNIDNGAMLVYAPGVQANVGTTGASSISGAIICSNLAIDGGRYYHAYDSTLAEGLGTSTASAPGYDLANKQQLK